MQKKQGKAKLSQRSQRFQESNYMDPNQSLCLGALFDIAATNVKIYTSKSLFDIKHFLKTFGNCSMLGT